MLNASLLCRVGRLRVSRSHGVPAVELPGLRRTKTTEMDLKRHYSKVPKCSRRGRGRGVLAHVGCACAPWRVSRPWARARVPSITSRDPGIRLHCGGPGHPASGAPVDLSSCAPRDRTIALTSWSSRQRTYVRARRPPRGLGLGPGGRLSTVRANARLSLFAWGPTHSNSVELRFINLTRYAQRRNAGLLRVNALNDRNMEYGALFLDSVTTQVSGVWVEFVLYSTLINLASRGRQRRLLGFCTSECIGSNH